MRPRIVAGAVLTVALVLVASPGIVGSLTPTQPSPPAPGPQDRYVSAAFDAAPGAGGAAATIAPLDPSQDSANALGPSATFVDPVVAAASRTAAPLAMPRQAVPGSEAIATPTPKPTPRPTPKPTTPPSSHVMRGYATWYDNGTTAMRLPRGTHVRICGKATCIDRTIGDYGPAAWTGRIVDMTPGDFRKVCGCGTGTGVTYVTIYIYGR